jgi:hypothetical protein
LYFLDSSKEIDSQGSSTAELSTSTGKTRITTTTSQGKYHWTVCASIGCDQHTRKLRIDNCGLITAD